MKEIDGLLSTMGHSPLCKNKAHDKQSNKVIANVNEPYSQRFIPVIQRGAYKSHYKSAYDKVGTNKEAIPHFATMHSVN